MLYTLDMKKHVLSVVFCFLPLSVNIASPLPAYSQHYDPARDPFVDGRAALQLAQQTNRRIFIEVGGNWCSWCLQLDKFLDENQHIREQLHQYFVVLKINVSEKNDNAEFMAGFPKPLGYPHIYIAEADGTIILSKDTAQLLDNSRYSATRFQQFIDKWKHR